MSSKKNEECFIIMPISAIEGYDNEHFNHVYEDIIKPACAETGYIAVRADEVKETNLIHLDILKKLIDAPIAICDLSTRNPNVLFELGIRQAFDKPVVLIQEKGTPKIFDIAPLRYLEYSKDMKYHEVILTQKKLADTIYATKQAEGEHGNINSIVRLMALSSPASIPNLETNSKEALAIDVLQTQMNDIRKILEITMMESRNVRKRGSITSIEYERISNQLDDIVKLRKTGKTSDLNLSRRSLERILKEAEEIRMNCDNSSDDRMFRYLMDKIHKVINDSELFY